MERYKTNLNGKVAVVTGGGGVLCSRFAAALAACGAKVAVLNRTLEKAQTTVDAILDAGGEACAIRVDVMNRESILEAHRQVTEQYGPCDILVNGAGGNDPTATCEDEFFDFEIFSDDGRKSFFDIDPQSFRRVLGLNLESVLLVTQIFAREMAERRDGVILNVSSMNAFTPLTKIPAYSAAKAALSNFTQWMAVYFAKTGIRVNAIAPGFFSTAQNRALLWKADGEPTERTEKILRNTPMGRFGKPDELIGTLLYLADDRASGFVTGVVIPVDGGFSAYSGV